MDSLGVLRAEPSIALFPAIAGLAGAVYLTVVLGGASLLVGTNPGPALFVVYLGSSFIAAFFTAALTYNAREVFQGRDPTVGEGLSAAWTNRGTLFVWALVSAVVGVLFRAVESTDNPVAELASFVFSVGWGILTYFVIPVIVFEEVSARGVFERFGETFKRTWGETAGAGFGVGLVTVLFTLAGLAVAVVLLVLLGGSAAGIGVALGIGFLTVLLAFLLGSSLGAIAKTALYVYATEGRRPGGFEDVDFATARR